MNIKLKHSPRDFAHSIIVPLSFDRPSQTYTTSDPNRHPTKGYNPKIIPSWQFKIISHEKLIKAVGDSYFFK